MCDRCEDAYAAGWRDAQEEFRPKASGQFSEADIFRAENGAIRAESAALKEELRDRAEALDTQVDVTAMSYKRLDELMNSAQDAWAVVEQMEDICRRFMNHGTCEQKYPVLATTAEERPRVLKLLAAICNLDPEVQS